MPEAEVGSGTVAAEGVEVAAADEDDLGDAEGGGAAGQRPHVVPLSHVVYNYQALHGGRRRRRGHGGW